MAIADLRHIEIFHTVMITGSPTEAAHLLHTSQSTVSRELAHFEKVIGLELLERIREWLYPTAQGLHLFEEMQRSWYGLGCIVNAVESLRELRQGGLSTVCLPVFPQSFLPQLLQPFPAHYLGISLNIVPQESPSPEEWLSAQCHDLELTGTLRMLAGTEHIELLSLDKVCVLPLDHPLAVKKVLTPDGFHSENHTSLPRIDSYRQLPNQLFAENQVRQHMIIEAHGAASVCAMVQAGIGVPVVNPFTTLDYAASGLVMRRLSIAAPFTVSLIHSLHRSSSAPVQASSERL